MNIRYATDFYSLDGVRYLVELIDNEQAAEDETLPFDIGIESMDGFTLSWEGDSGNRFAPIIGSSCSINMAVKSTDAAFIELLGAQPDNRFFLQISRYTGEDTDIIWLGEIAAELTEFEDKPFPYRITLQAYDTLSILKNIDFPAVAGTTQTVIQLLFTILQNTRIYQFYPDGIPVLKTAIQWYEDKMHDGSPASSLDPLIVTKIYHDAFLYEDNNIIKKRSCWEVLEQLCLTFGAHIFMSEGAFCMMNVNRHGTSITFRNYTTEGYLDTTTQDLSFDASDRIEGSFNYIPALGKAQRTYNYKQSVYLNNLLPLQSKYETTIVLNDIQGGATEQLLFSGDINIFTELDSGSPVLKTVKAVFHLRLKVGSYYLTNKNGYMQWTTTGTDRYIIKSDIIDLSVPYYEELIPVAFVTPYIPTTGAAEFEVDFYRFEEISGAAYTLPANYSKDYYCTAFNLRHRVDESSIDAGSILFEEVNDNETTAKYSDAITLPDSLLGDGPYDYSVGRLLVYNDSTGNYERSEENWRIDGLATNTPYNINQLLLAEVIGGQENPRKAFRGTIYHENFSYLSVFVLNGFRYTLKSGSFNAFTGAVTGEWLRNFVYRGFSTSTGQIIEPAITEGFQSGLSRAKIYERTVKSALALEGGGIFDSEGSSQIESLSSKTTPVDADVFMIDDSADSFKKKKLSWLRIKTTLSSFFYGAFAAQFNGTTAKTSLDNNDVFVLEDSAAAPTAYIKKSIKWSSIRTILNNVYYGAIAGQFAGTTEKTSIAANDYFIIEDSAVSNAKKSLKYSTLKTALDLLYGFWSSVTGGIRTNNRVGINTDPGIGTGLKVVDSNYGIDAKSTGNGALRAEIEGSSSFSAAPVIPLYRSTTSTAVNGIGMSIPFYIQNSAGSFVTAAYIEVKLSNATSGSEKAEMSFIVNSATRLRINEDNDIVVGSGSDIKLSAPNDGIILISPGDTSYRVTVDNSGNLVTTAI